MMIAIWPKNWVEFNIIPYKSHKNIKEKYYFLFKDPTKKTKIDNYPNFTFVISLINHSIIDTEN